MFGRNRKRRFEKAVTEEVAYMLSLHGTAGKAAAAAHDRSRRPNIPDSRVRVLEEAARRLESMGGSAAGPAGPARSVAAPLSSASAGV